MSVDSTATAPKRTLKELEREANERILSKLMAAQAAAATCESELTELVESTLFTNGAAKALKDSHAEAGKLLKDIQTLAQLYAAKDKQS